MLSAEFQFASWGFLFIYFRYCIVGVNRLLRCEIYISSQVSACSMRALVYILHAGCCYYTTELVDKINFFSEHVSDHLSNYAMGRAGDFVSAKLQQMGCWCSLWFVPEVWRSESLWGGNTHTGTNLRTYIHVYCIQLLLWLKQKPMAYILAWGGGGGLSSRQWEFEGWEGVKEKGTEHIQEEINSVGEKIEWRE